MNVTLPPYLDISPEQLGHGTRVCVRVLTDMQSIASNMAGTIFGTIKETAGAGRAATLIVPVGPVDQFPILVEMINTQKLDCRDVCLINMDEYLTDEDEWIAIDHPLSFRGFMNRLFYDRLNPELAPSRELRVFPHPDHCNDIQTLIDQRGGVDACFGGIGINGHIAFNEPPAQSEIDSHTRDEAISNDAFRQLPTRVLNLSRETRTINSVTVGGELSIIPRRAVTVGMKECLAARQMRFYCNRQWQSAVVRRALHGPVTPACPASFLQTHVDATITVADYVAAKPDIRLR